MLIYPLGVDGYQVEVSPSMRERQISFLNKSVYQKIGH